MDIEKTNTAVLFIDPQNDVLSEKGANWAAVGASVTENRSVENMERIFKAAKQTGTMCSYRRITFIRPTAAGSSTDRSRLTSSETTVLPEADR